jgi:hypothetical protein
VEGVLCVRLPGRVVLDVNDALPPDALLVPERQGPGVQGGWPILWACQGLLPKLC